jgi:hypothetical protein
MIAVHLSSGYRSFRRVLEQIQLRFLREFWGNVYAPDNIAGYRQRRLDWV